VPRRLAVWASLLLAVGTLGVASAKTLPEVVWAEPPAAVEQAVVKDLAADGKADFWVVFDEQADLSAASRIRGWRERGRYVYRRLTTTARKSQSEVVAELAAENVRYRSFWIANAILVRGGDRAMLRTLQAEPGVSRIAARWRARVPEFSPTSDRARTAALEWNIGHIRADAVWELFDVRGEGVVVGSIDSGVQFDHPALAAQYRGNVGGGAFDHSHNWWDPSEVCGSPSLQPCDNNGHGTHTVGTILGDDNASRQIGVAPRARWIAAKGCEEQSCSDFALLSSAQFMLAPTDLEGRNPRPELRPHVINNSWGTDVGSDVFYREMVQAWVAAGIFPSFANGNNGPECGTVGAPASYPESYGVGAFDRENRIASFSARGASPLGGMVKPQIAAPGVAILSSIPGSRYGTASGTSMAAPHLTGAVALIVSGAPQLAGDIEGLRTLLDEGAVPTEDLTCGGEPGDNNVWGRGRLDVLASLQRAPGGSAGGVSGTIANSKDGEPIVRALVTVRIGTRSLDERSAGGGTYMFARLPAGSWEVTATAPGYRPATRTIDIVAEEMITADFALSPLPSVAGVVRDANDGEPVAGAEVQATNGEAARTVVTGPAGTYSLFLDLGSWTVTVERERYATQTRTVDATEDGQSITLDIELATGRAAAAPGEVRTTVPAGGRRELTLRVTNTGTADLTWEALEFRSSGSPAGRIEWLERPVERESGAASVSGRTARPAAIRWEPDRAAPTQSSILVYADDWVHGAPNTYVDQALRRLGLPYTAYYDGNLSGFNTALSSGDWDVVVFAAEDFAPLVSTLDALHSHVVGGGKAVVYSWYMRQTSAHPLWAALGVRFSTVDLDPPAPVYWWEPQHGAFTFPESAPEFTELVRGRYTTAGVRVDPLPGFQALAGWTQSPVRNNAALVLGNDERTLFRGFIDGVSDADLDGDGVRDGVELWSNLITGLDRAFFSDLPWLATVPNSGSLAPDASQDVTVTIDAAALEVGSYKAELVLSTDAARPRDVRIPVSVMVTEPGAPAEASQDVVATVPEGQPGSLLLSVDPHDRTVTLPPLELADTGDRLAAAGQLRPVTVTDTRVAPNPGWDASAQVSAFEAGDDSFGGRHLGWTPEVVSSSDGQLVQSGPPVAPGFPSGEGLSLPQALANAAPGSGAGTARLGAGLRLEVPVETPPGVYIAVLTLTAI
jgi:subtilisin family serine protease